ANTNGGGSHNANQDAPDGSLEGWRITYGYEPQSGSYEGETTYAPEPGTMALVLVGIAGVLTARRRRDA
ncbi:MAG: PEP-CTERM sorting domain-containing protein, partial [Armatimonadia bacterium]|nr:PEP-CTERM sorting domain-containing protein [Armatimonadia bacterium]